MTKSDSIISLTPPEEATTFGRNKIIYISGPMTNHLNYFAEFEAAEERLESKGFQPINPAKILALLPSSVSYDQMMHICFALINISDGIYMMHGWMNSKGAKMELAYAFQNNKIEMYEDTFGNQREY